MADVVVVTSPACHLCEDALVALGAFADEYPLVIREVDITSPEGLRLFEEHRPPMAPIVIVDGEFFSWGRLPRKKLRRLLERERVA